MNLDVYSVGHSNHPVDVFLGLLKEHSIETVADVRSNPHSRFAPRYNQGALREVLKGNGFSYIFLGRELGGRPGVPDFYNAAGGVLYERIAASAPFQQGIERLCGGIRRFRIAFMCAEENPRKCHRRFLPRAHCTGGVSAWAIFARPELSKPKTN
jgi:uncharacterized protein (DUF488 family)